MWAMWIKLWNRCCCSCTLLFIIPFALGPLYYTHTHTLILFAFSFSHLSFTRCIAQMHKLLYSNTKCRPTIGKLRHAMHLARNEQQQQQQQKWNSSTHYGNEFLMCKACVCFGKLSHRRRCRCTDLGWYLIIRWYRFVLISHDMTCILLLLFSLFFGNDLCRIFMDIEKVLEKSVKNQLHAYSFCLFFFT